MDKFSFSQEQRLKFIDFRLMFVGHFTRAELVEKFKSGLSSATRDINTYKELAKNNLVYDNSLKKYFITDEFKPAFQHEDQQLFGELIAQLSNLNLETGFKSFSFELPSKLNTPSISIVSVITQAIINVRAIEVEYTSLSSGKKKRTVVPHSIVDNGLRWHIRAYDLSSKQFRDFVVSRITKAKLLNKAVPEEYTRFADQQWMRIVPLELVPHPNNVKYPKAVELDYGMVKEVLKIETRAALTGYLLRRWNVDCSEDASQSTPEHQLWLRNRATLYGVENLHLASGYESLNIKEQENV